MQLWLWAVAIIVAIGVPCVYLLKRAVADRGGVRCQCGYDLTGNQSHVCPECGRATTCAGCGYDLTGNTTSVCPECGGDV